MAYQKAFTEGEVILVYVEDKPSFFARIEHIEADIKKRWWRVIFVVLTIPLTTVTWIIDEDQLLGADFTMGGIPVRLERVVAPKPQAANKSPQEQDLTPEDAEESGQATILSFSDRH